MRLRIRAAIAISLALHGTVLAWVQIHKPEPLPVVVAPPPAPAAVTVTQVEVEPLAVALLDDHTVAAIPAVAPPTVAATVAGHAGTPRISTGRTGTPAEPETKAEPGAKPHAGLMTMRKPEPPQLKGPSDAFWAQFDANTKPLQPKAIEGERIEDEVADAADHLRNPRWIANHSPEEVTAERMRHLAAVDARDNHELQRHGTGFEADHATFTGKVEADGTAHIDEKRSYDPTEILMRKYAVLAQNNLGYLWAHTTSTVQRKQALFEMWDECAETGTDELIAGGTAARKMIVGFIKGRMTGAAAYTPAELAALNAKKKSKATFDPYAD
jgi:hypothetical protein